MGIVVRIPIIFVFQETLYFTFLSLSKHWMFSCFISIRIKITSQILRSYFSNDTRRNALTQSLIMTLVNTLELKSLIRPNINVSNCNIQLYNFFLAETYEKSIFSHFSKKLGDLVCCTVAYISNCINIHLHMVFIAYIWWKLFEIFLINNILKLRIIVHFLGIIIKPIKVAFLIRVSFYHVGFFLEKVSEINRINYSFFVALRAYELSIAGPYSHEQLKSDILGRAYFWNLVIAIFRIGFWSLFIFGIVFRWVY